MNVELEIKNGRKMKIVSGVTCGCFDCIFTNYPIDKCPGFNLCQFLDSCTKGVYHYFIIE